MIEATDKIHALYAESRDLFFRKDRDNKTQFVRKRNGNVSGLVIVREGPSIQAIKVK
jgi:hypothetical protein